MNLNVPLFTVVVPVYNPPLTILEKCIKSIINQNYKNFELCIINASTDIKIKSILKPIENNSNVIIKDVKNEGISNNTNLGIQLANGEFIVFVDHDDELELNALLEMEKVIKNDNSIDVIYTDSDKISEKGKKFEPFFKPDWSPELMLCCNYATHLITIRKKILEQVGELKSYTDGAQDWDLILRTYEKTNRIFHIPKILYHWRILENSTASDKDSKLYALNAQIIAVTEYLHRKDINAYVIHKNSGYLDVKIPYYKPRISIIIYSEGNFKILRNCINSILNTEYSNYEIIISGILLKKKSLEFYKFKQIKFIESSKKTKSAVLNEMVNHSKGELILFINENSKIIENTWLKELSKLHILDKIAITSPKIIDNKKKIKYCGMNNNQRKIQYPFLGLHDREALWTDYGDISWYRNYNLALIDCMLVKKSIFLEVGKFNETEKFDIDFCTKIEKNGYRLIVNPNSVIQNNMIELKKD